MTAPGVSDSAYPSELAGGAAAVPNALRDAVLLLIPIVCAAVVYFPITGGYFFADDFLHIYRIRNEDFLAYLLVPRGGHLLVTNNAVFYVLYRLFGTHAEGYYCVALFTHLINVGLLFWVIRLFTDSPRLASFGATLWGISPMNEAAVGWFSVFGQVLVSTVMLTLLIQMGRIAAGRPLRRYAPVLWCGLLLAACTSFGIGIGVALMFPIVAFLLLPPGPQRKRIVIIFCILAVAVPALYVGLTRLTTMIYQPRTALLFIETNVLVNLTMLALITGCGIATLIASQYAPNIAYPSPVAWAIIAVFVAAVGVTLLRAPSPVRRRLLVCIILCLGCYGMIVAGRAAFFAASAKPQAFIRPPRYHYAAPIPLAIALCLVLAYVDRLLALRDEAKTGLFAMWLLLTGLAWHQFGKPINVHAVARRETTVTLAEIQKAIDAAAPGEAVYIPHRKFQSLGPIFVGHQDIFPGWAGVFVVFYDDNVVDGKPVYFTTPDDRIIEAAQEGRRSKSLLIKAPTND